MTNDKLDCSQLSRTKVHRLHGMTDEDRDCLVMV